MYTRAYREGLGSGNPLELQNFNVQEVQWNFVEMHCPLDQYSLIYAAIKLYYSISFNCTVLRL